MPVKRRTKVIPKLGSCAIRSVKNTSKNFFLLSIVAGLYLDCRF